MLDVSRLCEIAKNSYCFYNIPIIIEQQIFHIPIVFTGRNGIYIFVEDLEVGIYFTKILEIQENYFFLFVYEEQEETYIDDNFFLYDTKKKELILLVNPYTQLQIFYDNHLIPQADLPHFQFSDMESYLYEQIPQGMEYTSNATYIKPIVPPSEVVRVENRIEELLKLPRLNQKIRIRSNGIVEVLKERTRKVGFIDTMYPVGTKWYRCSERNSDDFYLFTFFCGMIGLHKFADKKFVQGFLYLCTFGMGGVCYVLDLFTMILGNYCTTQTSYSKDEYGTLHKQQECVYNKPLEHKVRAVVLLAFGIIVAILGVLLVFKPFVMWISSILTNFWFGVVFE